MIVSSGENNKTNLENPLAPPFPNLLHGVQRLPYVWEPEDSHLPQTLDVQEFRYLSYVLMAVLYISVFSIDSPPKLTPGSRKYPARKFHVRFFFLRVGVFTNAPGWFTQDLKSRLLELQRLTMKRRGKGESMAGQTVWFQMDGKCPWIFFRFQVTDAAEGMFLVLVRCRRLQQS